MTPLDVALASYLTGIDVNGKASLGVVRTGTNLQTLVTQHGAVIKVTQTGGVAARTETRPRVAVEVYADTHNDVWTAALAAQRLLLRPYFTTRDYLIDYCLNESANHEQPHDNLWVLASVWRVITRVAPA